MLLKWLQKIPPSSTTSITLEKDNGNDKVEETKQTSEENYNYKDERNYADQQQEIDQNGHDIKQQQMDEECRQNIGMIQKKRLSRDQIELVPPCKRTLRHLMLLNSMALPINYGDERAPHYRLVLKNQLASEEFFNDPQEHLFWTKIAYYKNSLVGAITLSRQLIEHDASLSEPKQSSGDEPLCFRAIILTLAVIPTFRRHGVATILMEDAIQQCERWGNIQNISLHCQASNESARAFYKWLNFVEMEFIQNYYASWRISEPDAYRMELTLPNKTESSS